MKSTSGGAIKCKKLTIKILSFFIDYARKKWPLRGSMLADYRLSAAGGSGFGCQEVEVLNPKS
jgi:hypothetical protein